MSDTWNITLRLGAWSGQVSLPKSQYSTAKQAIDAAAKAVLDLKRESPKPPSYWQKLGDLGKEWFE
jgi:hypothetical protein